MAGPKHGEFEHPPEFGFTGSAGSVHVAPHVRQPRAPSTEIKQPVLGGKRVPKDFARAARTPGGFARGGVVDETSERFAAKTSGREQFSDRDDEKRSSPAGSRSALKQARGGAVDKRSGNY